MLESAVGVSVAVTCAEGKGADTVMMAAAVGALLLAPVVDEWRGACRSPMYGAVDSAARRRQACAGGRRDRASRGEQHAPRIRAEQKRTAGSAKHSPLLHDLLQCAPAVRSRQRRRSL